MGTINEKPNKICLLDGCIMQQCKNDFKRDCQRLKMTYTGERNNKKTTGEGKKRPVGKGICNLQ